MLRKFYTDTVYQKLRDEITQRGRSIGPVDPGDERLGPFMHLRGTWSNVPNLIGRGWNMIALPFAPPEGGPPYRLLLNQYNEALRFDVVDKGVPNRGILPGPVNNDQLLVAIDYEQTIRQIRVDDRPESTLRGDRGGGIHHEPGLLLQMLNEFTGENDVARLATIPHGDALLALGRADVVNGPPVIPDISGLPIGATTDLNSRYLAPYKHFHDNLFEQRFDPTVPNALLNEANKGVNIVKTTVLDFDTQLETGGILNIPFVVRQANATSMRSTFWIQELAEKDAHGNPKRRLQYSQVVMLDFFARTDGTDGLIAWPHVSINTLEKVSDDPDFEVDLTVGA